MAITTELILVLVISYIIVVLARRLHTLIVVVVTSIIIYSIYELLQQHGVGLNIVINTIIINTEKLIEKILEILKAIIQQLQA